jgi:GNAT superfamily N-acetyltransferase
MSKEALRSTDLFAPTEECQRLMSVPGQHFIRRVTVTNKPKEHVDKVIQFIRKLLLSIEERGGNREMAARGIVDVLVEKITWGIHDSSMNIITLAEPTEVVQLARKDGAEYKGFFLKGVESELYAPNFGLRKDDVAARTDQQWGDYIDSNYVVGVRQPVYREGKKHDMLVGIGSVERKEESSQHHKGTIGKFFVHPAHQTYGLGAMIVSKRLEYAISNNIMDLYLTITDSNIFVKKYFESLGAKDIGLDPRGAEHNGEFYAWRNYHIDVPVYASGKRIELTKERQLQKEKLLKKVIVP